MNDWKRQVIRKTIIKETYIRILKYGQRAKCQVKYLVDSEGIHPTNTYFVSVAGPGIEPLTYALQPLDEEEMRAVTTPHQQFELHRVLRMVYDE